MTKFKSIGKSWMDPSLLTSNLPTQSTSGSDKYDALTSGGGPLSNAESTTPPPPHPLISQSNSSARDNNVVLSSASMQNSSSIANSAAVVNTSSAQAQTLQCDNAYHQIKNTIETALSLPSVGVLDMIRIMEASQRIHWQLVKYRSRLSATLSGGGGGGGSLKRRVADYQSREAPRDKRFSRGYTIDKLRDLKPSISLHLYPSHFKVGCCDDLFEYDGPMQPFLDAVFQQRLIPDILDILESADCAFYDGCLVAELFDHRAPVRSSAFTLSSSAAASNVNNLSVGGGSTPLPQHFEVHRLLLRPTHESIMADIRRIQEQNPNLSSDALLRIEADILAATESNICLRPSPEIARISSIIHYNNRKFNYRKRRRMGVEGASNMPKRVNTDSEADLLACLAPKNEILRTSSDFKRISFIEDWKKNKESLDIAPIAVLEKSRSPSTFYLTRLIMVKCISASRYSTGIQTSYPYRQIQSQIFAPSRFMSVHLSQRILYVYLDICGLAHLGNSTRHFFWR
eukprot:Partr_v1_DN28559_c3_g1_i4_m73167 putative Conserved hypothetical protein